jgi:hypothetical protein
MENFALTFFKKNGARKDYLKSIGHDFSNEIKEKWAESLVKDLTLPESFIEDGLSGVSDLVNLTTGPGLPLVYTYMY